MPKALFIYYNKILEFLWAATLISLPVTSFPLLSRFTRSLVAPLAGLPVLFLCLLWFIPKILRRGQVPLEAKPLLIFIWISLITSAGAFFIEIPSFKESNIFGQELRAYITLAIGTAFYLVTSSWPSTTDKLRRSFFWISLGGAIMLVWNLTQVVYLLSGAEEYPAWVFAIQKIFVIETGFFFRWANRLSGLTYEPSWFTYQMTILYFPLWVSASLTRQSTLRVKWKGVLLEDILLILALLEFLLSAPRISLISLMAIGVLAILLIHKRLVEWITPKLHTCYKSAQKIKPIEVNALSKIIISAGLLICYLGCALGLGTFLVRRDERLHPLLLMKPNWQEISRLAVLDEQTWLRVSLRLAFFERVNYWFFGLHVFERYPWLGVGLGNAGFFYLEALPAVGWESYETRALTYSTTALPNIKNLWIRLLAETGLAGFAAFMFWLFVLWRSTRFLSSTGQPFLNHLALFGQLSLAALLIEGFSIDSFAMPYLWITAGLISAAGMVSRNETLSRAVRTPIEAPR